MHVSAPWARITSDLAVLILSAIGVLSALHLTTACEGLSGLGLVLGKVFFPACGRHCHSIMSLIAASP